MFLTATIAMGFLVSVPSSDAVAATKPAQKVVLTPEYLRTVFLANNIPLLNAMNSVEQSKTKVNGARAALFPALNLNFLGANPASFIVSSVQMLMPFLFPSNWFNLKAADRNLYADGQAYYLVELNGYASVYSLLNTIVRDGNLEQVYATQYADQKKIEEIVAERMKVGISNQGDLDQASAQANISFGQLSQIRELIAQETAALREMLGLPLTTQIEFKNFAVSKPSIEGSSPASALTTVLARAPEMHQIKFLIDSAKDAVHAGEFSFFNQASLVSSSSGGKSAGDAFSSSFGLNFNLGIFSAVQLAQLSKDQLVLRQKEIGYQEAQLLESNLLAVDQAEQQYYHETLAEKQLQEAYQIELQKYAVGVSDLQSLLIVRNNVTTASVARLKAELDVYNLRINLHRILLTDEFSKIHDCVLRPNKKSNDKKSMDQLCQQVSAAK